MKREIKVIPQGPHHVLLSIDGRPLVTLDGEEAAELGINLLASAEQGSTAPPEFRAPGDDSACQMAVGPLNQCCCNCIYHRPVHFHCCTEPKPAPETHDGRCCCGVQKGWACASPEHRIYDNWPLHSCGCELYTPRAIRQRRTSNRKQLNARPFAEQ